MKTALLLLHAIWFLPTIYAQSLTASFALHGTDSGPFLVKKNDNAYYVTQTFRSNTKYRFETYLYDANGILLWNQTDILQSNRYTLLGASVDANGMLWTYGVVSGNTGIFVRKYTAQGLDWMFKASSGNTDKLYQLIFDVNQNAYVYGSTSGTLLNTISGTFLAQLTGNGTSLAMIGKKNQFYVSSFNGPMGSLLFTSDNSLLFGYQIFGNRGTKICLDKYSMDPNTNALNLVAPKNITVSYFPSSITLHDNGQLAVKYNLNFNSGTLSAPYTLALYSQDLILTFNTTTQSSLYDSYLAMNKVLLMSTQILNTTSNQYIATGLSAIDSTSGQLLNTVQLTTGIFSINGIALRSNVGLMVQVQSTFYIVDYTGVTNVPGLHDYVDPNQVQAPAPSPSPSGGNTGSSSTSGNNGGSVSSPPSSSGSNSSVTMPGNQNNPSSTTQPVASSSTSSSSSSSTSPSPTDTTSNNNQGSANTNGTSTDSQAQQFLNKAMTPGTDYFYAMIILAVLLVGAIVAGIVIAIKRNRQPQSYKGTESTNHLTAVMTQNNTGFYMPTETYQQQEQPPAEYQQGEYQQDFQQPDFQQPDFQQPDYNLGGFEQPDYGIQNEQPPQQQDWNGLQQNEWWAQQNQQ